MKERGSLKGHIQLCGKSDGKLFYRKFQIIKKIDEGAYVICYEASHERSGKGILKEFYPKDAYSLERRADGQLVHIDGLENAAEDFQMAEMEYLETYEMLLKAKQNDENQDLSTFIPAFEIYHGCDEEGNVIGTTYIWTPEPKLETFDSICDDIHKFPRKNPEHKLVLVLSAIETLTKCVCSLHKSSMVHRDIKPSNLGFIKRGDETLTQTLSLFDINSVCSVYHVPELTVYSEGYMEPEIGCKKANNQTDIYAIGATLYHAIVNSPDTKEKKYLYSVDRYDDLERDVDESELIKASEANSHPRLKNILTNILKKCLCDRDYRYKNCEELKNDLDEALYYALPSEVAKKSFQGDRWILTDVEKFLDKNTEKNSLLALQYHLYENPLYRYVKNDEEYINVAVIGFGKYGQKFLDVCLQIGQIIGKTLNVTVFSKPEDDVESDKDIYLKKRPELNKFFNIDGCLGNTESYGNIVFKQITLSKKDNAKNTEILQDVICDAYENDRSKVPKYIFIALGEDELNLKAARACKEAVDVCEYTSLISFAWEGKHIEEQLETDLLPVYVNNDVKKSYLYPEIERMAFNVHLIWEKNLNIENGRIKAEFRKQYNHDACVGNVLSLKYKLYSIGIDLEKCDFREAAKLFKESGLSTDRKSKDLKNQLVCIEHRRWVVEKLCLGWTCIKDLNECAAGITKDEKRKRHICIVHSRPDEILSTEFKTGGNYDKWDQATKAELDKLDELDRVSVELHRMYSKRADVVREQNLLNGNIISEIKLIIDGNRTATVAFQEWYSCLKDIWNKDRNKVKLYKGCKTAFLNSLSKLSIENKKSVVDQVKAFEALFYPILASMEYRDYKQDDVALIDNIPFILTYSESIYMVIPYSTGDNTEEFSNVAAATVVNPARIIYLAYLEKPQDIMKITRSLSRMSEYMKKKHFKAVVEFILVCSNTVAPFMTDELKNDFVKESNGKVRLIKIINVEQKSEVKEKVVEYLSKRRKGKRIFAVEKNCARISDILDTAGFYSEFDCYTFDSMNMKFESIRNCNELTYISKSPYVSVNDMIAFSKSSSESSNQPEFFDDYKELWGKYREKNTSAVWKQLCEQLCEHSKKNDVIATLKKQPHFEKGKEINTLEYILPYTCSAAVRKIFEFLKEHEIIESGSRVIGYTSDSCEVIVKDRCGYKSEYDRLFSNPYMLMAPDSIACHLNTKSHEVNIVFDNLIVNNFKISGTKNAELGELLKYFSNKRYIINLTNNNGVIGFTYATRQIKELLTTAGKLLEVYVYHKIKELGRFDDVVSSFEVNMENTEVKSEFDAIITKGFRSIFVECKATMDIQQEYYYKLAEMAHKYGINGTAVLIADTQEKPFYDSTPVNAMQRQRGNMLGIITIYKPDEINNIGHTLLRILTGKYTTE